MCVTKIILGYDLKIICYDDGPEEHPQEVKDELEVYQIDYIVGRRYTIYLFIALSILISNTTSFRMFPCVLLIT